MEVSACLLVGLGTSLQEKAVEAVRRTWPGAQTVALRTLAEAWERHVPSKPELLVLASPDGQDAVQAADATDALRLRRWGIVSVGPEAEAEGVEFVSPRDCTVNVLAHVFVSAMAQYRLVRELQRCRGDLRTVAHRISHDLRTPLGGIVIAGEALRQVLSDREPDGVTFTAGISDSADDLMRTIDRVSLVLKATAASPRFERMSMANPVHAALQRLESRIGRRKASLRQPDDWPEVEGVGLWLETIWWNLLSNVLEHAGAAPRAELGWQRNDAEYAFWVRDHGEGIDTDERDRLFQPFHLLHRPNSAAGLGLSIVHRLVELHGGRCEYRMQPHGGSSFSFTIPDSRPPRTQSH